MSGIINKVKEAIKPHHDEGVPEGTAGPHNSRVANAADPRVDSDLDGRGRVAGQHEFGATHGTHTSGLGGTTVGGAPHHGTAPHSSHLENELDPRVNTAGMTTSGTHGYNTGGMVGGTTVGGATHHAPGSGATGMTGTHGAPEGTFGPHGSRLANAADPRVDSDRDGRANVGYNAPGPAPNTAGPHSSNLANKMDPRVDSDLDGSKTVGGNRTFQNGNELSGRDPRDAAQVPPSVLRQHIGEPAIEHSDAHHNREARHSISHQEQHRGL